MAGKGAGDEAVRGGASGDGVQGGHEHRQPLSALRGMGGVGLTACRVCVVLLLINTRTAFLSLVKKREGSKF